MGSHFKIKNITDLKTAELGATIPESDYSVYTSDDKFVQFEFIREDETLPPFEVKPGIYSIGKTMAGYKLNITAFSESDVLEEYVICESITKKIKKFFDKKEAYMRLRPGETPKRGFLLYGAPGCGKSQTISKVCKELVADQNTMVLIWHTDKFEPSEVKDFIKSFTYVGVEKFILVAEDIGGTEMEEVRMRSDSSLLSLLDNVEKTFSIPTIILATTNYPASFMGNLTNRPQRFDQCIEVKPPMAEFRGKFLEFFSKHSQAAASSDALALIVSKKCDGFSIAHIKEAVIRAELEDVSIEDAIREMLGEVQKFTKNFEDKRELGLGMGS